MWVYSAVTVEVCCRCLARVQPLRCWINSPMFFSSVVTCRDWWLVRYADELPTNQQVSYTCRCRRRYCYCCLTCWWWRWQSDRLIHTTAVHATCLSVGLLSDCSKSRGFLTEGGNSGMVGNSQLTPWEDATIYYHTSVTVKLHCVVWLTSRQCLQQIGACFCSPLCEKITIFHSYVKGSVWTVIWPSENKTTAV